MTPEEFQTQFNSRTLAYVPGIVTDTRPLVIAIGTDAHSVPGHALVTSLINLTARAHRHLRIVGDVDRELEGRPAFGCTSVRQATLGLAQAINPFIDVELVDSIPSERLVSLGVGSGTGADIGVGCQGWLADLGRDGRVDPDRGSVWGALLASVVAAGGAFNLMRGMSGSMVGTYSLWDWGRLSSIQGPLFADPLDVGRVLQVGVGGVGAALDFFLVLIGVLPAWTIIDGDYVDVSNLNRQLLFVARDAGYPDQQAAFKAQIAAKALGAVESTAWYGEEAALVEADYDVVLALANDRGARMFLQARQPTVLLHATTSLNFGAQFHRHIAGRDDCIECRIPPEALDLGCGGGSVKVNGQAVDAALPHLSAAAGLLLAAGLARLSIGQLAEGPENKVTLVMEGLQPFHQQVAALCRTGCRVRLPANVRSQLERQSRYAHLDGSLERTLQD